MPVATLGIGEIVSENLLGRGNARWCLQPLSQIELLVVPRKEWTENVRPGALHDLKVSWGWG